ncbi:hypothetical protein HHI36_003683 [Cryptolaemus montrouzieri]|uniref:Nudix hydrolase domain-containing protein n=1 Tax=Cryptolaemus montrouzieri TaxID=559131 RepID=A0ABD2PF45_9CUCU
MEGVAKYVVPARRRSQKNGGICQNDVYGDSFSLRRDRNLPEFLREWRKFKLTIPTYGAIFISPDDSHVLMVQGYSGNWSFPRGKMESGENPEECAVREVLEEVGFDISHLIKSDEYMENKTEERYSRLYIIKDIAIDTILKLRLYLRSRRSGGFPSGIYPPR